MDVLHDQGAEYAVDTRPFDCTFDGCLKSFARKSDLVRHERIHNNERCGFPPLAQSRQPGADEKVVLRSPWICDWLGCKRDFIQRSALIVHQRTQSVSLSPSQTLIGELIRGTTARANGRTDVRSAAATRPSAIPAVSLATDACVPASRALRIRTPLRSAYARRFILASGLTTAPSRLV